MPRDPKRLAQSLTFSCVVKQGLSAVCELGQGTSQPELAASLLACTSARAGAR
jgi:hypothetical protein